MPCQVRSVREDAQELDSLSACPGACESFGEHKFGTPRNPFEKRRLRLPQADQPIAAVRRRPHYQIERAQFAPSFPNVGRRDLRAVGADYHHGFVIRGKGLGKRGPQSAPQVAVALRARPPTRPQPRLNLRDRVVRSKPQLDLWQRRQLLELSFDQAPIGGASGIRAERFGQPRFNQARARGFDKND